MKKVILGLSLATMIISCKDFKEGMESEMKKDADTVMTKTENVMDTTKVKIDTAVEKSVEKAEETTQDVKESSKKK